MSTRLYKSENSYEIEYEGNTYTLTEVKSYTHDDIELWDDQGNEIDDEDLADDIIGKYIDDCQNNLVESEIQ